MGKRRGARGKGQKGTASRLGPQTSNVQAASAALIIFAKAPIPGQVKTRLCPPLAPDEAATLHGTFVLDALERSGEALRRQRVPVDRFLACSPSPAHAFFKVLEARHGVRLLPQLGDELGARMAQALHRLLGMGYRKVLLAGTDVPGLPLSVYGDALTLLADHDLVLGPALDGGYYLIGLTRPIPELFADIPWSTDQTLSATLKKAEALGLRTGLLPACRDIDRLEDLQALIQELDLTQSVSTRTAGVLRALASRLRTRTADPEKMPPPGATKPA